MSTKPKKAKVTFYIVIGFIVFSVVGTDWTNNGQFAFWPALIVGGYIVAYPFWHEDAKKTFYKK